LGKFKCSKTQEEEASDAQQQKERISILRKDSRKKYLIKREYQKLQDLHDELKDQDFLFEGMELTTKDQASHRYKKEAYELATRRKKDVDVGYHMPIVYDRADRVDQEKRFAVERNRDVVVEEPTSRAAIQEAWEKH
jgi:pre-mRNA-splicing factor ATP-dependent RNA helicase DHX16